MSRVPYRAQKVCLDCRPTYATLRQGLSRSIMKHTARKRYWWVPEESSLTLTTPTCLVKQRIYSPLSGKEPREDEPFPDMLRSFLSISFLNYI